MGNPMQEILNQTPHPQSLQNMNHSFNNSNIKTIIDMLKKSNNPQALLTQMASQNPLVKNIMNLINQSGGDARAAVYKLAEQKGINPNDILSFVNQFK